jgi:hypothetical protein
MQFARFVARSEERADEVLGAVSRTRVSDHPARDMIDDRQKATLEIRDLVLDDHIQTEQLGGGHVAKLMF